MRLIILLLTCWFNRKLTSLKMTCKILRLGSDMNKDVPTTKKASIQNQVPI